MEIICYLMLEFCFFGLRAEPALDIIMKTNVLKKLEIKNVEETSFSCPECWNRSDTKLTVLINDEYEKSMCIYCHNKIAHKVFEANNKKRRRRSLIGKL